MELKDMLDNKTDTTLSGRELAGTAKLTEQAAAIMNEVLKSLEGRMEELGERVKASRSDNDEMDSLITTLHDFNCDEVQYLKDLPEDVTTRMLKSQQSKRSRLKGKTMTLDTYRGIMIAAIAEILIRTATGKEKGAGGAPTSDSGAYSEETLKNLAADQNALRKEIRNVQSKKSIMKSKEGFSEDDPRWHMLLAQEEQLKSIRVSPTATAPAIDETQKALAALLEGKDIGAMKASEAKKLLEQAAGLVTKQEEQPSDEDKA